MDRIGDRATHNDGDSWMPIVPVHRSFPFDIEFFFFFVCIRCAQMDEREKIEIACPSPS